MTVLHCEILAASARRFTSAESSDGLQHTIGPALAVARASPIFP